jgi:hypothetical protein
VPMVEMEIGGDEKPHGEIVSRGRGGFFVEETRGNGKCKMTDAK